MAHSRKKGPALCQAKGRRHAWREVIGEFRRFGRALQLGIEKGNVKARIVRHERRTADEG